MQSVHHCAKTKNIILLVQHQYKKGLDLQLNLVLISSVFYVHFWLIRAVQEDIIVT